MEYMNMSLEEELQKNFAEQFATNQNNHQNLFTQILSLLLTVIIGYGYVYTGGGKFNVKELYVNEFVLACTFLVCSLIIFFGLILVCDLALGFRRDQYVVYKIRKKNNLIDNQDPELSIFPESYNPGSSLDQKDENWKNFKQSWDFENTVLKLTLIPFIWKLLNHKVCWMPNYHNIHFLVLATLNCILLATLLFNPNDKVTIFEWEKSLELSYTLVVCVWLFFCGYVWDRVTHFRRRLSNLYQDRKYYS